MIHKDISANAVFPAPCRVQLITQNLTTAAASTNWAVALAVNARQYHSCGGCSKAGGMCVEPADDQICHFHSNRA